MDTKQQLETSLKDAMRSGDVVSKRTIRMVLTNLKMAEVEKGGRLDENAVTGVLQKEIKSRRESILEAQKANRPDLIKDTQDEIVVLEKFLPPAMSDEDLRALVQSAIDEVGAKQPSDMGKVMKVLLPRIQGRAANDRVSQTVRQLLQS